MAEEKCYPKTQELLYSMAFRYDHGFGLYEKEDQDRIVEKMDKLYDAFFVGKNDEQISEELKHYIVTVKQLREEVNGKGFYQPTNESKVFYQAFKKK